MNEREHGELQSLLGAFALNATDSLEARRVERHLSTCEDCANEVRLLREAASELAWLAEPADTDDLVDRISTKLPARPRRLATRISVAVAAVAVAAAGALGGVLINERGENARFADVIASADQQIRLGPRGGFEGRGVLHVAADEAVLVLENVPDAGRDRAYQLWAIAGSKPTSMGVIDASGRVVQVFDYDVDADTFAITIEPDGGSPVPTTDPVLFAGT